MTGSVEDSDMGGTGGEKAERYPKRNEIPATDWLQERVVSKRDLMIHLKWLPLRVIGSGVCHEEFKPRRHPRD